MKNQYKILAEVYTSKVLNLNSDDLYYVVEESMCRGDYEWDGAALMDSEEIKKDFYNAKAVEYFSDFCEFMPYEQFIKELNAGKILHIYGEENSYAFGKDKDTLKTFLQKRREDDLGDDYDLDEINQEEEKALNDLHNKILAYKELYKDNPGINIDI